MMAQLQRSDEFEVEPQNLIVFVAESQSAGLLGCAGDPFLQTPHLDRLAGQGVRFPNTYCASPICVPSRASIATGLYPHQSGHWENSLAYHGDRPSWMARLRDAGHEVTAIGKLHFRSADDDNGFTEEIETMHLTDGIGELIGLLRCDGEEPVRSGLWDLYTKEVGVGDRSPYREYDFRITEAAVKWLNERREVTGKPWVLCVHYVSAHPPFVVPQRIFDLYPPDQFPMPVQFSPEERPNHPALIHLRNILGHVPELDEALMRRIIASYYGLITHLDEQVGSVLASLQDCGLSDQTRIIYTADHGYNYGNQYILSMANLYDRSVGVPLILSGRDIPQGRISNQIASHVDLYPTILESMGLTLTEEEMGMSGISLWSAMNGEDVDRQGFAEFHAGGSKAAGFMLREGDTKFVYHVGMPPQLFDLATDPDETIDLVANGTGLDLAAEMERKLREILDPEETDQRAKSAQRQRIAEVGGKEEIMRLRGGFSYSPPPEI